MQFPKLTNPHDDLEIKKPKGGRPSRDFCEAVVKELIKLTVPKRTAEVIVIDQKTIINVCCAGKLDAEQTASMLYDKAVSIYQDKHSNWYCAGDTYVRNKI